MTTERPDKDAEEQGALEKRDAGSPDVTEGETETPVPEERRSGAAGAAAEDSAAATAPETSVVPGVSGVGDSGVGDSEPGVSEPAAAETPADEPRASEAAAVEAATDEATASEPAAPEAATAEASTSETAPLEAAPLEAAAEPPASEPPAPEAAAAESAASGVSDAKAGNGAGGASGGGPVGAEEEVAGDVPDATPGSAPDATPDPVPGAALTPDPDPVPATALDPVPDATPDPAVGHSGVGRRRSPVLIASVAAAVLLVGGGGAYLAASASGGSGGGTGAGASGGGTTPPALSLDGYSQSGSNGIAPGEPNPYGVTYKADGGLPDGPDSAPVYRASGEVTRDEVARLAKALGLDGAPVEKGQAWQVGPSKDGSGPSLVVNRQAPGTWTFHRYAAGTDACQSVIVCAKDPANPAGATVSEAVAKKAAAPILKAVGQDDAKVDASQVIGAQRAVDADPVVGGLPTHGWTTGLTVGAKGEVVGGSGQLKAPVKGDSYPVLGAEKTLALLNAAPTTDHRMGIGGCASPVPLKDRFEEPCGQGTSAPTASTAPAGNTVTVEKAVFGLASHTVSGGQPALVPSWLFEVRAAGARDTFTATYPAIDPKYLTTSAVAPSGSSPSTPDRKSVV